MKLGPLRFLGLVMVAAAGWTASRVPVVVENARSEVAAAVARQDALPPPVLPPLDYAAYSDERPVFAFDDPRPPTVARRSRDLTPTAYDDGHAVPPQSPAAAAETEPQARGAGPTGHEIATQAYRSLARGDRREAARGFAAAVERAPRNVNAKLWRTEFNRLTKHWSGEAYSLVRRAGNPGVGSLQLLGGGQSGAWLAWTRDPLAKRPIAVVARVTAANVEASAIDQASAQGALGIRWQVLPVLSLTAERLFALGPRARNAWIVRAAGGDSRNVGPARLDGYAEAGMVGLKSRDLFAGVQARAVVPLAFGRYGVDPGVGVWASLQHTGGTVYRVDSGPTLGVRAGRLSGSVDYRFRLSGDALPGSGPALTMAAAF